MATVATVFPADNRGFSAWFADFLRSELAPYPGRGLIVARMVIAATITMILIMTFRIPGGAIGPLYALLLSRESLVSTAKSGLSVVSAFALCGLFIPIGAHMFASIPITHFLWEGISIFFIFFLIHTLSDYSIASGVGLMATSAIALWYLPGPSEMNVERTLWQVASPAIGVAVTLAVEAVFHSFHPQDELIVSLDARLESIEDLLQACAAGAEISKETNRRLVQYAMVGVGRLRRMIARSNADQLYRSQMTAVVSLTGRSIDFAAGMSHAWPTFSEVDRQVAAGIARQLADIRECLKTGCKPKDIEVSRYPSALPLLREMEGMIGLIPHVFAGSLPLDKFQVFAYEPKPKRTVFVSDAFTNPEHVRYALSGCLAGMLCYILYVLLAWPGLATSVTTCALTALSSIGTSRQKQVLRISGALIGGFIFGLGAQIFVLPYIDSITGFTLLFAAVSAVAAWVATSSTRLSYCGLQIALAFYLVHVNDFTIQLSLSIARDRVLGVLLGIVMMWLVFERFHPKKAAVQMVETFAANLRLLAELAVAEAKGPDAKAIVAIRRLRDRIYNNFSSVNAQADAIPFELGERRMNHMAARDRIRRWQAMLRTFYLLQLALLQSRVFGTEEQLSDQERATLAGIDQSCARVLVEMAKYLEAQRDEILPEFPESIDRPLLTPEQTPEKAGSLLSVGQELSRILDRMREEMLATPLFSAE